MLEKIFSFVRDYGMIDELMNRHNQEAKNSLIGNPHFERMVVNSEKGDNYVCFLPWRTGFKQSKKFGLFPRNSRAFIYEGPAGVVNPDPKISREMLLKLIDDFESLDLDSFHVLGYSAGCFPAFYIANHFNAKSLTAVAPGSKMGAGIWGGIATQEVCRRAINAGYDTPGAYDTVMGDFNPIQNLDNLPDDVSVHIGLCDKYVPYNLGEELVVGLEVRSAPHKVFRYGGRGHVTTMAKFGRTHKL